MIVLNVFGYIADAAILGAYFWTARTGRIRPFHLANALGCFPLIALEVYAGIWPVLVITATFGAIGWFGLWRGSERQVRKITLAQAVKIIECADDLAKSRGMSIEQAVVAITRVMS